MIDIVMETWRGCNHTCLLLIFDNNLYLYNTFHRVQPQSALQDYNIKQNSIATLHRNSITTLHRLSLKHYTE